MPPGLSFKLVDIIHNTINNATGVQTNIMNDMADKIRNLRLDKELNSDPDIGFFQKFKSVLKKLLP